MGDAAKSAAARAAVDLVLGPGGLSASGRDVLGIGSGSTVAVFVPLLCERLRASGRTICAVPTSYQAEELIRGSGGALVLTTLSAHPRIAAVVDGADEVCLPGAGSPCPGATMIKGGGAAMVREKVVAEAAARRIFIVDSSKVSAGGHSGRVPVPVEVLPWAAQPVLCRLAEDGHAARIRQSGLGKAGPVVTDDGNLVIDVAGVRGLDAAAASRYLSGIAGVVGHGYFTLPIDSVIVGLPSGAAEAHHFGRAECL